MLISNVTLYSNKFSKLKDFYVEQLGFPLLVSDDESFSIKIGDSVLEIIKAVASSDPFYHFAFNIDAAKFQAAKEWAKTKVVLNKEDGKDEVYFENISAKSFYFLDPANNIVEFIARNSMETSQENSFSIQSVMNISEINITTNKVIEVGNDLINFGIPVRFGKSLAAKGLNFMGDNHDAFLLLGPIGRRWYFSDLHAEIHPLSITIDHTNKIDVDGTGEIKLTSLNKHD